MKKVKELLCFIVPIFAILTCFYFLLPNNEFLSREGYLRLYFDDDLWLKSMIFSLVVAFAVAAIAFVLKSQLSRKIKIKRSFFYIGTVVVVSISVFTWTIIEKIIDRAAPTLQSYTPPLVSEYEILGSLLFAVFATFVIWIVESIIDTVKKKN